MPSDSNGVYDLPAIYRATPGTTIKAEQHNGPLEDLRDAMTQRLLKNGNTPMTGQLKGIDGTEGAPSFTFASTLGTGFYKTTNGIGVSVAGTKVAEFSAGGILKGARYIGELIQLTGSSVPPLTVSPFGQTLSRTAFPDLWAHAQASIAAGYTIYNNGDGANTFGIMDMRGTTAVGADNIGGSNANRVPGLALGARLGAATHQLNFNELPVLNPQFVGSATAVNVLSSRSDFVISPNGLVGNNLQGTGAGPYGIINPGPYGLGQVSSSGTITPQGFIQQFGSGFAHNNMQPSLGINYALFAGA